MKILIATPLFPPETASQAVYTKEVVRRLANEHEISILTHGEFPEEVPKASIYTISKKQPRIFRFFSCLRQLIHKAKTKDILYIQNGVSIEIPLFFLLPFIQNPIVFHISDIDAYKRTQKNFFLRYIEQKIQKKSHYVLKTLPEKKPEIIPFERSPQQALIHYEEDWNKHLKILKKAFYETN